MTIETKVLAKLNGGRLDIRTDLLTWRATWTRRCCCGDSDRRDAEAATLPALLGEILAWEESVDAEYVAAGCK